MVFRRATTLVARGRYGQTPNLRCFFNPFPLRDFPYLVSLAGAEKITLSYYIASWPVRTRKHANRGYRTYNKKRRLRDITSGSRLVGFTILPVTGVSYSVLLYFDNTIFVITILFLFLLFLSVYPLCNKPLHSRPTVFQHNTLFIFYRV